MPNNPYVKPALDVASRMMPPRTALIPVGGVPAGECLNNWIPAQLGDGALCYVIGLNTLYQFKKFSMLAPATNTCIATMAGTGVPGRWVALAGDLAKAYCSISYAGPNSGGDDTTISCLPLVTDTWTPFEANVQAIELATNGALTFDNNKTILVGKSMTVKIDWFASWQAHSNYLWTFGVMLNGAVNYIPGTRGRGYYSAEASANEPETTSASAIANLAQGDSLQLMVRTTGQISNTDIAVELCTLSVTEV